MLLKEGDKILVAHRRLFEKDKARFFVGRVAAYENGVVKATGHSYVRDIMGGRVVEKAEERTKMLFPYRHDGDAMSSQRDRQAFAAVWTQAASLFPGQQ